MLFVNIIYILYICTVFGSQTNTKGKYNLIRERRSVPVLTPLVRVFALVTKFIGYGKST